MTPILYIAIVACSASQSALSKLCGKRGSDPFRFNFYKATFALALFFAAFLITERTIHTESLIYGAVYGATLAISMHCGYTALRIGPLSLTSMLATFSLIIPCLYGAIFLKETVSTPKALGFVFLALALIFLNIKEKKDDRKPSLKWAVCITLTIVANGVGSVLQKLHQISFPGQYRFTVMCSAMLVCVIAYTFICIFNGTLTVKPKTNDLLAGTSGVLNGLSNFFTLWLAGLSAATLLFPLVSAGTMLMALLVGKFVFKEKLTTFQIFGFAFGVTSVVLLNL